MAHQHKQPKSIKELNPDVPDALVVVVERLMQKNPTNRYANFAEVIAALRPLTGPRRGSVLTQRRPTMVMPRVRLPRPGAPEAPGHIASPPSPIELSRTTPQPAARKPHQPLPPRSPSALAGAKAPEGGRSQRPADRLPVPPRKPVEPVPENVVIRHPPPVQKPQPEVEAQAAPQPVEERAAGFGLVTVILLAALAGAAAFFLSKLIPF